MPTPIDELLITVEVEQGSKLDELHRMLKEFQSLGGKLEVEVDLSEISEVKDIIVSAHDKINVLTNILIPLVTKYPSLLESIQNLINDNFQAITKDINSLLEWRNDLNKEVSSILTNIDSVLKSIELVNQNIDKFKDEGFYKKIIDELNQITKNIRTVFQEQVFDEIKNKIDDIRQQVDKTSLDTIKSKIEEILKLNFPKNFRSWMRSQVVSKIVDKLTQVIKEKSITEEKVKKICDEVFSGIRTGDYEGSRYYGLDESDMKDLINKAEENILKFLETFARGQSRVNKRILDELNGIKSNIGTFPLSTADLRKTLLDVLNVLHTIKTFVYTGEFKGSGETIKSMADILETIRLTIDQEVAKNRDMEYLKTSFKSVEEWIRANMVSRSDMWSIEGSIGNMEDTLKESLPKKKGDWKNIWGSALETELAVFKEKLDENLKLVFGEQLDDWAERQAGMASVWGGGGGELTEELQFIKGMLNDVAQMVVTDWIEELGILTRQMLQILEDFGEQIFEKLGRMGGDWNTLLHNYLRQELKIDRLTNLLGEKIVYEKQEFADLQQLLYNFDIPEKFEVLHEKIDNFAQILNVPGGWEEILGSVDYIWDKIQHLLRVLKMNDKVLQVLKEVPDLERMGPVTESLDALMKILTTTRDVKEALLMWRGLVSGARAGLRNIDHVSQIVETKRVLELEKITKGSRVEDISEAIEDQIIRPYGKVWNKIAKDEQTILKMIEKVKSLEEQNMDKDSLNKAKLKE